MSPWLRRSAMQRLAGALLLSCIGHAHAVQPVEQGLQPILARLQAIHDRQSSLNLVLQSASATPEDRAQAYRTFKQAEQERTALECALERSRRTGKAPLVTYTSPERESSCKNNR